MSKIYDITDKLSYEESPVLKIKDIEVHVNDDAPTMIKIMGKLGNGVTPQDIADMYELIIPEKDREKIDGLKLNFSNFQKIVKAAIDVATGKEINLEDNEETETE